MDIEFSEAGTDWRALFIPISSFPVGELYTQEIALENTFSIHPSLPHGEVLLTLVDGTLLLSDPQHLQTQPYAALQLDFDLKFEVLRQPGGLPPQSMSAPAVGFRLFYDQERGMSFYSSYAVVLEGWVAALRGRLNQRGFHEMFRPLKKLGKGNFASVYEVERVGDGRRFAVKAFSKQSCFAGKHGKESLINQLAIMRQLALRPHPNVLQLEAVFESDNSIYVVLELLTGGQLFHRIQQANGYFSPHQARDCIAGLLRGLRQMHGQRILHRDLKPENIMLRGGGSLVPVIVDFGLATPADIEQYLFFRCGTPGYVAPEIIEQSESRHVEPQCDVFSAGVIFHILLTGKPLFQGTKYEEVYRNNKEMNVNLQGELYEKVDPLALELLRAMLQPDPALRFTAQQALSHPYFAGCSGQVQEKVVSPCLTESSRFHSSASAEPFK